MKNLISFLIVFIQIIGVKAQTYNLSVINGYGSGNYQVGDTIDVFLPYADYAYRITFFGDDIEDIDSINIDDGRKIASVEHAAIFPANLYVATKEQLNKIIYEIQDDLNKQTAYFKEIGKHLEAARLKERVTFDLEMMRELGYCSGIENYSLIS